MTAAKGPSRHRIRWDAKGLVLEQRQGDGGYQVQGESGLQVPPTPMAVTHPEMRALLGRILSGFRDEHLGDGESVDIALAPPWGNAWLLDVGDLPDDEIEEQVAWELQQRLDSPLDEYIYAWHPFGESVYAIVIRPELIEFWDELSGELGISLGAITLRTGLVDADIERSADLLPLYRLWVERRGGRKQAPHTQIAAEQAPEPEESFDDADSRDPLGEEGFFEDFAADLEEEEPRHGRGRRAVDPDELDDQAADDALDAILNGDRRPRRRRLAVALVLVGLLLIGGSAGLYLLRDRLPSDVRVRLGSLKGKALALVERAGALFESDGEEEAAEQTAPERDGEAGTAEKREPEAEAAPAETSGTERKRSEPDLREAQLAEEAPPQERTPEPPPPPPRDPTAGNALTSLLERAEQEGVRLASVVMQDSELLCEVAGPQARVRSWIESAALIPGGEAAVRLEPAPGSEGTLVRVRLQLEQEGQLTPEQFNRIAEAEGVERYGDHAWRAQGEELTRLLSSLGGQKRRPYRLSVHRASEDTYLLAMLP